MKKITIILCLLWSVNVGAVDLGERIRKGFEKITINVLTDLSVPLVVSFDQLAELRAAGLVKMIWFVRKNKEDICVQIKEKKPSQIVSGLILGIGLASFNN